MDETIFNEIRAMERDLTFYENAICAMISSLRKNSMQAFANNGSYPARELVKELNQEIKKVVERNKKED